MSVWISMDREAQANPWAPLERRVHKNPGLSVDAEPRRHSLAATGPVPLLPPGFWRRVVRPLALSLKRAGEHLLCLAERRGQLSAACD